MSTANPFRRTSAPVRKTTTATPGASRHLFESPFHAQPDGRGNLAVGFSVNSRYRALDAIPFTKQIKFDMELWHWADTQVNYAPSTFWYARPGATCNVESRSRHGG